MCMESYSRNAGKSSAAGSRSIANIMCQAVTQKAVVGSTKTACLAGRNVSTGQRVFFERKVGLVEVFSINYMLIIYCILQPFSISSEESKHVV